MCKFDLIRLTNNGMPNANIRVFISGIHLCAHTQQTVLDRLATATQCDAQKRDKRTSTVQFLQLVTDTLSVQFRSYGVCSMG